MDVKHMQIYSVQHTGSKFIKHVLLSHGWDFCDIKHYQQTYFTDSLCVSPIRNPKDAYISWISRGKTEDFYKYWCNFNDTYLNNTDLWIVPVDTPDRDYHLSKLSDRLDCKLSTDWQPVGCGPRENVPVIDLSAVYDLPVVKNFYCL